MKNLIILIVLFPLFGITQTYTVTTQTQGPNYSAYTGNGMTTSTSVIQQTKTSADHYKDMQNNITNSTNQAIQANAQRAAAQIQANAQIEAAQLIIDNQNRIENERKKQLQKELLEKQILEEEKNPNSILNKFKNLKLNQENEDLKNKLLQMELLLAEKEKIEKEKTEKEKIENERIEKEKIEKEKTENERIEKEKIEKEKIEKQQIAKKVIKKKTK